MSAMTEIKNKTEPTIPATETQDVHVEQQITTTEEKVEEKKVESMIPHISLWSIKTNKSVETKEEIKEDNQEDNHDDKRDELMEVLNRKDEEKIKPEPAKVEPVKPEPVKTEEKKPEPVKPKKIEKIKPEPVKAEPAKSEPIYKKTDDAKKTEKSVEEIEKEIDEKVKEETNKKFNIQDKKLEKSEKKKELFWNYKTDYKEKTILENIKEKKKNLKEKLHQPKTRILLVASLLILVASGIWWLFVLDSDNHSVDIYKTRIMSNVNNIKAKYIDKPWISATISVETITFDIFTQEKLFKIVFPDSTPNYKYNSIVYKTKEELETTLKKEVKTKKEEIARQEAEIARQEAEQLRIETEQKAEIALIEKKERVKTIIRNVLLEKFK